MVKGKYSEGGIDKILMNWIGREKRSQGVSRLGLPQGVPSLKQGRLAGEKIWLGASV